MHILGYTAEEFHTRFIYFFFSIDLDFSLNCIFLLQMHKQVVAC